MKRMAWHGAALASILLASAAGAAPLAPHRAVYDLSLASQTEELLDVEGRIALDLQMEGCTLYDLDYRFVARFSQDGEETLTDQRTRAQESTDGRRYTFETQSFVDGMEQPVVSGTAETVEDETGVALTAPVEREFALPASRFPLGHTAALIERALAGERMVQLNLFDGDAEGDKQTTTSTVIMPLPLETQSMLEGVEGLRGWRVDESYFNADSDADGLPIFHTRYTLYENGVTDEIYMDFGPYALEGALSELTLGTVPSDCG